MYFCLYMYLFIDVSEVDRYVNWSRHQKKIMCLLRVRATVINQNSPLRVEIRSIISQGHSKNKINN